MLAPIVEILLELASQRACFLPTASFRHLPPQPLVVAPKRQHPALSGPGNWSRMAIPRCPRYNIGSHQIYWTCCYQISSPVTPIVMPPNTFWLHISFNSISTCLIFPSWACQASHLYLISSLVIPSIPSLYFIFSKLTFCHTIQDKVC